MYELVEKFQLNNKFTVSVDIDDILKSGKIYNNRLWLRVVEIATAKVIPDLTLLYYLQPNTC